MNDRDRITGHPPIPNKLMGAVLQVTMNKIEEGKFRVNELPSGSVYKVTEGGPLYMRLDYDLSVDLTTGKRCTHYPDLMVWPAKEARLIATF